MMSLPCVPAGCPYPLDPLAGPRAGSSMPFPVPHSPSAKGGCEVSTVPMSPYAHHMAFFFSSCCCLTLITQPSPATLIPQPLLPMLLQETPPEHILRLEERPQSTGQ